MKSWGNYIYFSRRERTDPTVPPLAYRHKTTTSNRISTLLVTSSMSSSAISSPGLCWAAAAVALTTPSSRSTAGLLSIKEKAVSLCAPYLFSRRWIQPRTRAARMARLTPLVRGRGLEGSLFGLSRFSVSLWPLTSSHGDPESSIARRRSCHPVEEYFFLRFRKQNKVLRVIVFVLERKLYTHA